MPTTMTRSLFLTLTLSLTTTLSVCPAYANTEPVVCAATATPTHVPWGSRYSYWLQGVAEFDEQGRMLPVPFDRASDWSLFVTSARNSAPTPLDLLAIDPAEAPNFAFPAVTSIEWDNLDEELTTNVTSVFSAEGVSYGLFLAIRNPQRPAIQPLFQVIHYLAPDFAIVSDASTCFVGVTAPDIARPTDPGVVVPFETLARGSYSGINQPFERVVNDNLAWRSFWRQLNANIDPTPDLPEVDLTDKTVIAVGLGDRASGAYSVEIDTVRLVNGTVVVHYTERRSCGVATAAITQPYHLVLLDRTTAPVEFRRSVEAPVCP
ncbi:hypothetical protein CKA32_004597 [Geitlerinema sp. FC II]|nr:hypothetical protein CKA32_004597 [Geitlerinema sp. FC II]